VVAAAKQLIEAGTSVAAPFIAFWFLPLKCFMLGPGLIRASGTIYCSGKKFYSRTSGLGFKTSDGRWLFILEGRLREEASGWWQSAQELNQAGSVVVANLCDLNPDQVAHSLAEFLMAHGSRFDLHLTSRQIQEHNPQLTI
jgi:hypothetical protein